MSGKKETPKPKRRKVTFTLVSPEAREVILMGDFNQWNPARHPMKKDAAGVWQKTTLLFPGRYEYRFLVDNHWENDPRNPLACANRFGTQNNLIVVPAPQTAL